MLFYLRAKQWNVQMTRKAVKSNILCPIIAGNLSHPKSTALWDFPDPFDATNRSAIYEFLRIVENYSAGSNVATRTVTINILHILSTIAKKGNTKWKSEGALCFWCTLIAQKMAFRSMGQALIHER